MTRAAAQGINETYRVQLDNGMVGYHKPFSGTDDETAAGFGQASAQQPIHEAAAWQLAKGLGGTWEQIVPPVVVREVNGSLGSLALERPGRTGASRDTFDSPEWKAAAFYDALIGQQDRHPYNYLLAGDRLTLIDHGFSFAEPGDYRNYSVLQDERWRRGEQALTTDERAALDRLLASPDLFGLTNILEPGRAKALRRRAQRMRSTGRIPEHNY